MNGCFYFVLVDDTVCCGRAMQMQGFVLAFKVSLRSTGCLIRFSRFITDLLFAFSLGSFVPLHFCQRAFSTTGVNYFANFRVQLRQEKATPQGIGNFEVWMA